MKIVAIMGPTASGKSFLALKLAQKYKGEIINFDSMQVYKNLDVMTACPSRTDKKIAPHHLYQFQDVSQSLDAAAWAMLAKEKIEDIQKRGNFSILVGGTGFYLKTLMEGISPIPDVDDNIVESLAYKVEQQGMQSLYADLQKVDPQLAEILKPNDKQRIIRALSVYETTQIPLSIWQKKPATPYLPSANWQLIGLNPNREELYKYCDSRFDDMLLKGGLDEAYALYKRKLPYTLPALRAVGIRQLIAYFDQKWDLEMAIIKGKTATRNYAKRQSTWVRNQLKNALIFSDFGHNVDINI